MRTRYKHACLIILAVAFFLPDPHQSSAGEPGTEFMLDLWKYRTGEANTGLLTGRPSHNEPQSPPAVFVNVTGTVDCLQALPLHPQDIIEVQLLDFSSRGSAAVIAHRKITTARQIPVPFTLSYDPAGINPAHHYTVQARILRNGEPAYANTSPAFVLTHGYARNIRVLVSDTGVKRAARTDDDSMDSPSGVDSQAFIGTYVRKFHGANGPVEETLSIQKDHSVEVYAKYAAGDLRQSGVWSIEKNFLAVTVTHKNGEQINPERIVFELQGTILAAIEYDRAAHGFLYSFSRKSDGNHKQYAE